MDKDIIFNKPVYKYKPISYYSKFTKKENKEIEEKEEIEEYNYIMDEEKLNKLKALKLEKEKLKKTKKLNLISNNKEKQNNIDLLKINSLINLEKKINNNNKAYILSKNENLKKSKSVHELINKQNSLEIEINKNNFAIDLIDTRSNNLNKQIKKKKKKIIIKKKNNKNKIINNDINDKRKKSINKIQSAWLSYKIKKKIKFVRFSQKVDLIILKSIFKNFRYILLNLTKKNKNNENIFNDKSNELILIEKNYEILKKKYEESLKELEEMKSKIKQSLNLVYNRNNKISINIFKKKKNKRNNDNFVINKKSNIQILEKNHLNINKIIGVCNIFNSLVNIRKFNLNISYK